MKNNDEFICYIKEIADGTESMKKVTIDNLNLRKCFSSYYEVLLTIPKGVEVEIIPEKNGWSVIKYKDTIGFVANKYLKEVI